jgi:hypothetical protein
MEYWSNEEIIISAHQLLFLNYSNTPALHSTPTKKGRP